MLAQRWFEHLDDHGLFQSSRAFKSLLPLPPSGLIVTCHLMVAELWPRARFKAFKSVGFFSGISFIDLF